MPPKKNKKEKTIPLNEFLAAEPRCLTVRGSKWSEIVDEEEATSKPTVVNIENLPTAPRAAHDIDYSHVSNEPPFIAHVANISFQIEDEDLRRIFADLNPKSARIIREGQRSRGIGTVEFETRENLIEALKRSEKEVFGRTIHVSVSNKTDFHQTDGRPGYRNQMNRTSGEERPEMRETWQRAGPRSEENPNRSSGGFNRDRQYQNDSSRYNTNRGPRDNQDRNDYGFGYPRSKDDRSFNSDSHRDHHTRSHQRNRNFDDDNRSNGGMDRPRYAGRYSDTRDVRNRNSQSEEATNDNSEPPRERPRLQLQPRTKPLETTQTLSESASSENNMASNVADSSTDHDQEMSQALKQRNDNMSSNQSQPDSEHTDSVENTAGTGDDSSITKQTRGAGSSIFGGAKPVDTAAKEMEIERRLKELQMSTSETKDDEEEKSSAPRQSYNRTGDRDQYRSKRSSHNDEHQTRERHRWEDGRSDQGSDSHHKREYSGGRQYEEDNRRRHDEDHHRRGGDRDRYGGQPRRDNDSGRLNNKYNHSNQPDRDNERGNQRNRDREYRTHDSKELSNHGRSSNNNFNAEGQPRSQQRGMSRRTLPSDDDTHRLQLSNKFGMLNDEALGAGDENEEIQSPNLDE